MHGEGFPVVEVSSSIITHKSLLKKEIYEQLFKKGFLNLQ